MLCQYKNELSKILLEQTGLGQNEFRNHQKSSAAVNNCKSLIKAAIFRYYPRGQLSSSLCFSWYFLLK